MPYKNKVQQQAYLKGYYAGYKKATIHHLGNTCVECTSQVVEIHHVKPLYRQARTLKDLKDLAVLELRCKDHHNGRMNYK